MKWDILGKKKLNERLTDTTNNIIKSFEILNSKFDRIGHNIDVVIESNTELSEKINLLANEINSLGNKFNILIEELKKVSEVTPIPEVKPTIRNPEKIYSKEKKQEQESYNLYKN